MAAVQENTKKPDDKISFETLAEIGKLFGLKKEVMSTAQGIIQRYAKQHTATFVNSQPLVNIASTILAVKSLGAKVDERGIAEFQGHSPDVVYNLAKFMAREENLESLVEQLYPPARIAVVSSDPVSSTLDTRESVPEPPAPKPDPKPIYTPEAPAQPARHYQPPEPPKTQYKTVLKVSAPKKAPEHARPKPEAPKPKETKSPVKIAKRIDGRRKPSDAPFRDADIAAAAVKLGITDKMPLYQFVYRAFMGAGINPRRSPALFIGKYGTPEALEQLAIGGDASLVERLFEEQKRIREERFKKLSGTGKAPKMAKRIEVSFNYADLAAAAQKAGVGSDGLVAFARGAYERAGVPAEKARQRTYAFISFFKGHKGIGKEGDASNVAKYLPSSALRTVENHTEDDSAVATPKADYDGRIAAITKTVRQGLEKLAQAGAPPEMLDRIKAELGTQMGNYAGEYKVKLAEEKLKKLKELKDLEKALEKL